MLTYRQTRFIEEYLAAPSDPAGAALRAGYSAGRAGRQARALLAQPAVQEGIARQRDEAAVCRDRVIRELARIAFADPAEMLAAEETPHPSAAPTPSRQGEGFGAAPRKSSGKRLPPEGKQSAGNELTDEVFPASGGMPAVPVLPGGIAPGSGTGLKLKYTPKRAPDGSTVFELSMEREVRVGDKLRALEMLSRFLGVAVPSAPEEEGDAPGAGVIVLPEVEE